MIQALSNDVRIPGSKDGIESFSRIPYSKLNVEEATLTR